MAQWESRSFQALRKVSLTDAILEKRPYGFCELILLPPVNCSTFLKPYENQSKSMGIGCRYRTLLKLCHGSSRGTRTRAAARTRPRASGGFNGTDYQWYHCYPPHGRWTRVAKPRRAGTHPGRRVLRFCIGEAQHTGRCHASK